MPRNDDISVIIGGDISSLTRAMNRAERSADKSANAISSSFIAAGGVISSVLAGLAIKDELIDIDNITSSLAVIKDGTSSVEEFNAIWGELKRQSDETGISLSSSVTFFKKMSAGLDDLNVAQTKRLEINDLINKSLIASGASIESVNSFQTQFVQGIQSGVIRGEEFNSIAESNVVMLQAMAKAFGTNVGGLRALSKEGKITTEAFLAKLPLVADDINAKFSKMPLTITSAGNILKSTFQSAVIDANLVSNGTNDIANSILNLSSTVKENESSIQTLFSSIITGTEYSIKGITGLIGVFQAGGSAISTISGHALEFASNIASISDYLGVTENAQKDWQAAANAAFESANDLIGKASLSFDAMNGKITDSKEAQKAYKDELSNTLKEIEKDKNAHQERNNVVLNGIEEISIETMKMNEEMFKALGVGSEMYYKNEAQKILDQGAKWEELGASTVKTQQWMYDKITALSVEAWGEQHQQAGEYLDGLTASFTSATNDISSEIEAVNDKNIEIPADVNDTAFTSSADSIDTTVDYLTTPAIIPIKADISEFEENAAEVRSILDGFTGGGTGSLSVNTSSISELKKAITMLENTPTLDPFGESRKAYQEKINELYEQERENNQKLANQRQIDDAERAAQQSASLLKQEKAELDHIKKLADIKGEELSAEWLAAETERIYKLGVSADEAKLKFQNLKNTINTQDGSKTNKQSDNTQGGFDPFSLFKGVSFDGGGYTGDSPRVGGLDGKGGFLALLHPQETVIDRTVQNQSDSSPTVINNNVTVNVSKRLTQGEIENIIRKQTIQDRRALR